VESNQSLGAIVDVIKPDKLNQIIASDDSSQGASFDLMKHLKQESIIVPLKSGNKKDIIYELVEILEKSGNISNFREVCDAVIEREESMSTGLGEGVAFPHARTDMVENITVAIGVSKKGIEFDAIDKKPVYIVALILSPLKDSTPHLQFLSEMSKILSKVNVRERIMQTRTANELYEIFKDKDW
jgi:fructose-specific phosphotransferase system IIA component